MKMKVILTILASLGLYSLLSAEVLLTAKFDEKQPDAGWSGGTSDFFADARLTTKGQSHVLTDYYWQAPSNYGLPLSSKAFVTLEEGYSDQVFTLLPSNAILQEGATLYFSFTLSSQVHGGTRFLFARAGTEENLRNANLQVIQIRTGAFRLLDDSETLAETEEIYFRKSVLVVGMIDYDTGVFKLKVYPTDQLIDPEPTWDIESVAVPYNVYDRLAFRVAPNAYLGNIVIGESWADVTGVE